MGQCRLRGPKYGQTHGCCEELVYWSDEISGSKVKSWFTGVKGLVAFNCELWFSVVLHRCMNLQQGLLPIGFLRWSGWVAHMLGEEPAALNNTPFQAREEWWGSHTALAQSNPPVRPKLHLSHCAPQPQSPKSTQAIAGQPRK